MNRFAQDHNATIGATFIKHTVILEDGTNVKLQLWDTAGQERFRSMLPMYYRGASAAVLVYDTTNMNTFDVLKVWVKEVQRHAPPDLVLAFVGNKADLPNRRVSIEDAKRLAAEIDSDAIVMETSALTGQNIQELFASLSKVIVETNQFHSL
ncbi:hypothetical protein SAMD00019534_002730, partial [Acytostelium subglobosum LB1]|uniref:hypothetical protein n=1 Tax=Acytostelium subglobosum LB1 TaxID=1410327 RepID=UPI000644AD96